MEISEVSAGVIRGCNRMKVALVYDRVNKIGGAERVLMTLHEIWPKAPLYTAVYNPQTAPWAKDFKVIPSFLQKFPFAKTNHEFYPWLTPLAFESFNFDDYDVVVSVTSEAAKGIITKPKTLHLCYCLTPTRYLWSHYDLYFQNPAFRFIAKPIVSYLRMWDKIASQRPDIYIAISKEVQRRIKNYYDRESIVVYPPIKIPNSKLQISNNFQNPKSKTQNTGYFLVVSRLVPYKRIDIAIEAFNYLGWPLKIIGTGLEMGRLKGMARRNIEFLGNLTDQQLMRYYKDCVALVFPGDEDLGLVILEAQNFGKPVIAFKGGGALETVVEGKTGEFFYPQNKDALIKTLKEFKSLKFNDSDCTAQAKKFNKKRFKEQFILRVEKLFKTKVNV